MIGIHANAGTIHSNLLVLRIDSGAELGDEFTVDLDASVGDDFLAFAAGSETCLCEQLLQADTFIVVIVRLGGAGICVWHRSPNVADNNRISVPCTALAGAAGTMAVVW